jgi:hypothetical protein
MGIFCTPSWPFRGRSPRFKNLFTGELDRNESMATQYGSGVRYHLVEVAGGPTIRAIDEDSFTLGVPYPVLNPTLLPMTVDDFPIWFGLMVASVQSVGGFERSALALL